MFDVTLGFNYGIWDAYSNYLGLVLSENQYASKLSKCLTYVIVLRKRAGMIKIEFVV